MLHGAGHKHWLPHVSHRDAAALYWVNALRNFGVSMPGIFLPGFLFFAPGKPVVATDPFLNNLLWVVAFFLVNALAALVANLAATNVVFKHLGFRTSMGVGIALLAAGMFFMIFTGGSFAFTFFAAVLWGMATHFFWIPFHIFFVRLTNEGGNFGEESAWQIFTGDISGAVGPLIGGVIIKFWGFVPLFWFACAVFACATVAVFRFIQETPHRSHDAAGSVRMLFHTPQRRAVALAVSGQGVEGMLYALFWPLLLFLTLRDTALMGFITAASAGASLLLTLWAGRAFERHRGNLFRWSAAFNALWYLPRIFVQSAWGLYGIDLFDRLNAKVYNVGILSRLYDLAKETGESEFIIARETLAHAAQVGMLAFTGAALFLGMPWRLVFVVIAIAASSTLLLFRKVPS
jgi:hypothetical protein